MWTVERKPWSIDSGSTEGGLFKTTDGGDHAGRSSAGGLPSKVMVGKIGVSMSRADSAARLRAWSKPATTQGGVYRSDDARRHLDADVHARATCSSARSTTRTSSRTR